MPPEQQVVQSDPSRTKQVSSEKEYKRAQSPRRELLELGLSMGSEHSSYVAGLDKRFRCAVLSCNLVKVRPMIERRPMGHCQYVPSLGGLGDTDDVSCLIPQRPVFVEHGIRDVYDRAETEEAIAKLKSAYECYGVTDNIEVQWFDNGHRFWGQRSIPWLESLLV